MHHVAATPVADLMSEARKFGLSATVATQYAARLDERAKAAVYGNAGTLVATAVGRPTRPATTTSRSARAYCRRWRGSPTGGRPYERGAARGSPGRATRSKASFGASEREGEGRSLTGSSACAGSQAPESTPP